MKTLYIHKFDNYSNSLDVVCLSTPIIVSITKLAAIWSEFWASKAVDLFPRTLSFPSILSWGKKVFATTPLSIMKTRMHYYRFTTSAFMSALQQTKTWAGLFSLFNFEWLLLKVPNRIKRKELKHGLKKQTRTFIICIKLLFLLSSFIYFLIFYSQIFFLFHDGLIFTTCL